MNKPIFLRNHIAIESSIDLEQIGQPLKKMGIDLFCCHRLYDNGTEIMLCSDVAWTNHYYSNGYFIESGYIEKLGLNKFDYIIWPNKSFDNMRSEARAVCNIHHVMDLKFIGKDYFDIFGFATKSNNILGINMFLNNIETLKKFSFHFKKIASHILTKCESNRIIPVNADYLSKTRLKNIRNSENQDICLSKFSDRELECIRNILIGKSMRETAEKLLISPRTVETHVENIKNKLGCNKKSDMISKLLEFESIRFWSCNI